MSTYAIGDVQGCYPVLLRLLAALQFDPAKDQLWFAGDLVNRGPESLQTLRFVKALGSSAVCVLGNHDLHLLARAAGGRAGRQDTLDALLAAPDSGALLDWLRCRPILHESNGWALVHAGIAPQWSMAAARLAARELETALQGENYLAVLAVIYGDEPARWSPSLVGIARLRFAVNAYTRMRYCEPDGALELRAKGAPGSQLSPLQPWFACSSRTAIAPEIIFGHWSSLGQVHWQEARVWGLDTGAAWGGQLTALNLETRALTSVDCPEHRKARSSDD